MGKTFLEKIGAGTEPILLGQFPDYQTAYDKMIDNFDRNPDESATYLLYNDKLRIVPGEGLVKTRCPRCGRIERERDLWHTISRVDRKVCKTCYDADPQIQLKSMNRRPSIQAIPPYPLPLPKPHPNPKT